MNADEVEFFPYQLTGADWLASKRLAYLADEPGLGKSAQAVRAADLINAQRILVLCPASIRVNWIRQFELFSTRGLRLEPVLATKLDVKQLSSDGLTCSYDLLLNNEISTWLTAQPWDLLVLDEAHYLKSPTAARTASVLAAGGLIHRAKRTWCLSGTPTPNHAGELYPIFRCFGIAMGSYEQWLDQFCVVKKTPFGQQIVGSKNIPELRQLMAPVILRRRKEDVMTDLPPIQMNTVAVEPGPVDYELYFFAEQHENTLEQKLRSEESVLTAFVNQHGSGDAFAQMLTGINSKTHTATTYRRHVGLQKVQAVVDILTNELDNKAYEKVVIFAVHKDVIHALQMALKKYHPVTVYGGTPAHKRQRNIDKFRKDPKCRVFLGNIQAAGVGVDGLQEVCHEGVFIEQDWTPGNNSQAAMRLHRIGQKHPVRFRIFQIDSSTDTSVQRALLRKTKDILAMFDGL